MAEHEGIALKHLRICILETFTPRKKEWHIVIFWLTTFCFIFSIWMKWTWDANLQYDVFPHNKLSQMHVGYLNKKWSSLNLHMYLSQPITSMLLFSSRTCEISTARPRPAFILWRQRPLRFQTCKRQNTNDTQNENTTLHVPDFNANRECHVSLDI